MKRILLPSLLLALFPVLAFAQGTLTPPAGAFSGAAPTATMKTLDQVEARTPIGQVGGSFDRIVIGEPGSYVLLGNVNVTAGDAISITASDVTLDLTGFMLSSSEKTPNGVAISLGKGIDNVTVRNGHIRSGSRLDQSNSEPQFVTGAGFRSGILADIDTKSITIESVEVSGVKVGIAVTQAKLSIVRNCTVTNCESGIGADWVTDCNVDYCFGEAIQSYTTANCRAVTYGTYYSDTAINTIVATNCYARGTGGRGLYAGISATNCFGGSTAEDGIRAGSALNCTGTSQSGVGVFAYTAENCLGSSTSVTGLVANTASNCTGDSNSAAGLSADNATNCRGSSNTGSGLWASSATNCTGRSASGTGLFADNATNCRGTSDSGTGLNTNRDENSYTGTATGCTGISETGHGLIAAIATNCTGRTTNKSMVGVWVSGTATGCRGTNTGNTGTGAQSAISCDIAVACTRGVGGTINAGSKQLGTP